jgi:endogenous inhibitor of DNA gyrase (YacG/DUF329 family)
MTRASLMADFLATMFLEDCPHCQAPVQRRMAYHHERMPGLYFCSEACRDLSWAEFHADMDGDE